MNKKNGFTLLELLVVIGIIGILVSLATVAYSSTQRSARDTRRKQDMIAIQNALELYYAANSFAYPNSDCTLAQSYMKSSWPTDPDPAKAYTGIEACSTVSYGICAQLEGNSGNSGEACNFSSLVKNYYCIEQLQ